MHERIFPTSCEKIKQTTTVLQDWTSLCAQLENLQASLYVDSAGPVRAKISEIVPEYAFSSGASQPAAKSESQAGFIFAPRPTTDEPSPIPSS